MSRLRKKCIIVSMGMHLLLLLVVVFGVAFATSRVELPETNVITMKIEVDPLEQAQPRQPVQMRNVQPAPLPQTPRVKPKQPAPRPVKPEPPKQQPVKQPKKQTPVKNPVRSKPKKPKNISTTVVKRNIGGTPSQPKAPPRSNPIRVDPNAVNKLRQNLSTTSKVSFRPGKASYNRYKDLVAKEYQQKWNRAMPLKNVNYRDKTIRVSVTVSKTGRVVSERIVSLSGMKALDNSVKAALNAVRSIGQPFPPGVKEREQIFTVDFQDKR